MLTPLDRLCRYRAHLPDHWRDERSGLTRADLDELVVRLKEFEGQVMFKRMSVRLAL